jgi:hypothetical protein
MFKGVDKFINTLVEELEQVKTKVADNMKPLTENIGVRANYYVPYQTGATHDSLGSDVSVETHAIVGKVYYDMEKAVELRYARTGEVPDLEYVQYNHDNLNMKFNQTINPNASPQWLLKAFKEYEPVFIKELAKK